MSISSAGFEPLIPASDWHESLALDRSANGIGKVLRIVPDVSEEFAASIFRIIQDIFFDYPEDTVNSFETSPTNFQSIWRHFPQH
jgi:hypothetical protein